MVKAGLVLSGGGARGAYQAGVIKALHDILKPMEKFPFDVLCGVSAGSINASGLATYSDDFSIAEQKIEKIWSELTADQVIRTDIRSLGKIGATWLRDLSLGGALGGGQAKALLETDPLRELLSENFDTEKTQQNIESGHIHALAISATNIYTNNSVCFVQGHSTASMWSRHKRVSEATQIKVDHIMASSAIPIFFPSIEVEGRHFTDGCIGNIAPLSPAVHLGAQKIIAVGVRNIAMESEQNQGPRSQPSIAHLIGLMMNTIFMDSIEIDIQRMKRINEMMLLSSKEYQEEMHWKPIEILQISPSENIAAIASQHTKDIPRVVRYLMKGLGDQGSTEDIASYLLFDSSFCSRLIELGYTDAIREKENIQRLFES